MEIKTPTRIISFVQQKGGCGKTTTVANVGAYLAGMGQRVLLVDLDSQANLTQSVGVRAEELSHSVADLMYKPDQGVEGIVLTTPFGATGQLDLIPASLDLAVVEADLLNHYGKEWLLDEVLSGCRDKYDFILIDPPPSLGLFTVNALMASTEVIIPFQCHIFSITALGQLQKTLRLVQHKNKRLQVGGVVITLYDGRYSLSRTVLDTISELFGPLVFDSKIGLNSKLAEAPGAGKPILYYAPGSPGARAYKKLALEILERGKQFYG
ncbi:MAG: ParA family protein [Chloroflexota bacterium]|nr:ParA family protein [Chloroflexota bacterium]